MPIKKPYIRLYRRLKHDRVWIVDGRWIRANLDDEFTNFGHHFGFKFIPKDEIWLDRQHTPGEEKYFVRHALVERWLLSRGMARGRAIDHANRAERAARLKSPRLQRLARDRFAPAVMRRLRRRRLVSYGRRLKVYVVNGELVRGLYHLDFTGGGHDFIYNFIPPNEVWIDDDLNPRERPYYVLHELNERRLMAAGWTYNRAHYESAGVIERKAHRSRSFLRRALRRETRLNDSLPATLEPRRRWPPRKQVGRRRNH